MILARYLISVVIVCLASTSMCAQDATDAIRPFARNVARVIQDFDMAHAKKHQRPEKFCSIPTGTKHFGLLWVSTFDESYGCLFSSTNGRLDKVLDVGYNVAGEHVDLAVRNKVLIVTRSDDAGNFVAADFYRLGDEGVEPLDFVMKLVDGNEVYFNGKGEKLKVNKVQKELDRGLKKNEQPQVYNSQNMDWTPFSKIGNYVDAQEDITLSQMPVLTYANYKANEFVTSAVHMLPAEQYSRLVFKKQVGDVKFKQEMSGVGFTFELTDPKAIKTMFRGYKDNELFPIIVTSEYLETHNMMPFSRWKYPEKVTPMEREKQQVVAEHFGGRAIKSARWMANLEESDRKLYAVEFKNQGNEALAVIACFIGNRLVSTYDMYALIDARRDWLWTHGDKCNFMNALPELQGLATTDEGFELYMSQMVGDTRHMIVLREVASMFIELIDQEF